MHDRIISNNLVTRFFELTADRISFLQSFIKTLPVNCIGQFHQRVPFGYDITQKRLE